MIKTTYFKKFNGDSLEMNGIPKRIDVFDEKAVDADYVKICTFGNHYDCVYLTKNDDGVWRSPLWLSSNGYMCYELQAKRTNYALERVKLSEEEGKAIIAATVPKLMEEAGEVISWCDPKDESDADGRYWLSAYHGAGVYRLIVSEGKIHGAVYGGFHDCRRRIHNCIYGDLPFMEAIYKVVEMRLGTKDFSMPKADGSGTYFYLRNSEDASLLTTKEYDVPSENGMLHHNIEIV